MLLPFQGALLLLEILERRFLEELDVYVSSGSACAKGKPSYVLSAMGLSKDRADSALRISFSKYSTAQDVEALCGGIKTGLTTLAHR